MSLNAAAMRILVAKGLTAADLLAVAEAMETRSKAAERQSRYRKRRAERDVTGDVTPPPNDIYSNPPASSEPEGSTEAKSRQKKSKVVSVLIPEWMPPEPWLAFVAHRKAMRGIPFTDVAAKGVIAKVDGLRKQGHCPEKLLLKAVMHGWRTVFEAEDTKAAAAKPTQAYVPKNAADFERVASFRESVGDHDEAQKLRATAAKLRGATGPPRPIGRAVSEVVARVGG
jgi:hypothetical protein